MSMRDGDVAACLTALTDLVATARIHRAAAVSAGRFGTAQTFDALAQHLDRVRTRLTEDPVGELADAWAFVDAGRLTIARHVAGSQRRA